MSEVELYFPKRKEMVTISEKDFLPKEGQSKSEFLNKKLEIERQLDKHEKGLFSQKMKMPGLKCSQCSWLQFAGEASFEEGDITPLCWLYNLPRVITGKSKSERQRSFDSLECIGEKDADYLANKIMKVPAFIRRKGIVEPLPVRRNWFKKNFPKGYKSLNKHQKAILMMKGGKLYTESELKDMGEAERKIAEQKIEEEARKRRKKIKTLVNRIPLDEKVTLRAEVIEKIAKKRLAVLRKLDKLIKFYSTQHQKWRGKIFYDVLVKSISSDLAELSNYYLAARMVRPFHDVSDLYSLINDNLDRYGEMKRQDPPFELVGTPQVKYYSSLIGLGVFDYADFTKESGTRLKRYMKRKGIKATKKLPVRLSNVVHNEWVSVTNYKKLRKDLPEINAAFLDAFNTPIDSLLEQVKLDASGDLKIDNMPLTKRVAVLNAVYVQFAQVFNDKVRERLRSEKLAFDKRYQSKTSDIAGMTVKVPLERSEMVVLSKKSKDALAQMPAEKLQDHRRQIEEDVRYSPKYKKYVDGFMKLLGELDKEFVKLKIDPTMDIDPRTGDKYKDLTPSQKVDALKEAKKAIKELGTKFEKFGLKSKARVRFGDAPKDVKRLDKMTFSERMKALNRILERREKKRAEKEAAKKAKEKKKEVKAEKQKVEVPEEVIRSVRDEVEGVRSNLKVMLSYDISGSVLDVWEIESKMQGRDKKWHVFTPTRKREIKRRRKIIKSLLAKISEIEGVDMIVLEPDEKDFPFLKAMGFLPISKKVRKEIMSKSAYKPVNLDAMKLYMG